MGEYPQRSPSFSPPPPPPPPIPGLLSYDVLFSEPDDTLPVPLPSLEAIEDSPDVIKELGGRCTTRVGEFFVVKYGVEVEPIEAENMRFVREHTNVMVPRVYAVYQRSMRPDLRITYIIMENIPGDTLEFLWDKLSDSKKSDITSQLRQAFASLRATPHPGFFGSLGKSRLLDGMFWRKEYTPTIHGPFSTEDEFIRGMIESYVETCGARMQPKANYYSRVLPKVLRGCEKPIFTHADLQPKNIIIKPGGEVVMVDWAMSGWYPSYWEYAIALFAGKWDDDWYIHIGEFLEEFPNHYAWMRMMRIEMWS